MKLHLTPEEQSLLAGKHGRAVGKAMGIVVTLGRVFGARRLVPVSSVQVAGVSYRNLGEAGLQFLEEWTRDGARVVVPTTLNPAGMDLEAWRDLGFSDSFACRQMAVIDAYRRLGIGLTCTCTPYLVGNKPSLGEHVAWAESSAVSYANSVLGARTNREGGPSALAAAIAGRTAAYGLHLDGERRANVKVVVTCALRSVSDFGALGYLVGKREPNCVPYFVGLGDASAPSSLKALGAAMASSGAVALYHVEGVTPEAAEPDILRADHRTLSISDLQPAYDALNSDARQIELVWFGCPHASLEEIEEVIRLLRGRRVRSALWITVARRVRDTAAAEGFLGQLEACGGRLVADMCAVVAPMQELGLRTVATPSAKAATYLPSHSGMIVRYGSVAQCVDAAVAGEWPD